MARLVTAADLNAVIELRSAANGLESAGRGTAAMLNKRIAAVRARYSQADLDRIAASPEFKAHIASQQKKGGMFGAVKNLVPTRGQLISGAKVAAVVGGSAYVLSTLAGGAAASGAGSSVGIGKAGAAAAKAGTAVVKAGAAIGTKAITTVATAKIASVAKPSPAPVSKSTPVAAIRSAQAVEDKTAQQKKTQGLMLAGGLALAAKFLLFA